MTTIDVAAFYSCTELTSITLPSGVTTISEGAFSYCSNLVSIIIPTSVATIDNNAFYGCNKLVNIYYAGTEEQWNSIAISQTVGGLHKQYITYNYPAE